jgi:hypothetical protein
MKKILTILLILLGILHGFEVLAHDEANTNGNPIINTEEILDQSTPFGYKQYVCGAWNTYVAQSFKPTLSVLSKVELGLFKFEGASGNVTVTIREKLQGTDLTMASVPADDIPVGSEADWIEFDFEDIDVTPEKKYYIVFTLNNGERPEKVVLWVHTYWNPYWRGRPWQFTTFNLWLPTCILMTKLPDTSFRTYGYD